MYQKRKKCNNRITRQSFAVVILLSFILLLPQLLSGRLLLGSDSIFHLNRFYDTAMQIKEGNFQYFISMYGFGQSGRIVNALYSPYLSYIFGAILLLTGTWFNFQVTLNFLLYMTAGCSMLYLLRKLAIKNRVAITTVAIFLATFAIQYWITRQGFSSWGAAILPICLLPTLDMVCRYKIKPIQLGFLTALMMQVHFLSILFLVMIYIPCFIYAWIKSPKRNQLIRQLLLAIIIFFILTLNLWTSLVHIYRNNKILSPFINRSMGEATITYSSFYCLVTPFFLIVIIFLILRAWVRNKRSLSPLIRMFIGMSCVFLILSSNLIPWNFLVVHQFKLAEIVQFPFRFFIPASILLLVTFAIMLNDHYITINQATLIKMSILAIIQTLALSCVLMLTWLTPQHYFYTAINTYVEDVSINELKQSFYSRKLNIALAYVKKSTPDYLPLYPVNKPYEGSKYKLFKAQLLDDSLQYQRTVDHKKICITWKANKKGKVRLPIVGYNQTVIELNGEKLSKDKIEYSEIGIVSVNQRKGINTVTVSYDGPKLMPIVCLIPLLVVFLYISMKIVFIVRHLKKSGGEKN